MNSISHYKDIISEHIAGLKIGNQPDELYEPIRYILSLGGKQLRPILTLFSAEMFGAEQNKGIYAATAIELFHNFSLIHDDIMDQAPLRRGHQTVHHKWNVNTGILSGDAMLILAYQFFENYEPYIFRELAKLFSKTALEVCEGQQLDVNFETIEKVDIQDYIKMIEYKTAVLVGAALEMGAIVAETSDENRRLIYDFGRYLGIAFQIQDDYLDAFGNEKTFGKQVGGDIIENKKTFLYIKALELGNDKQRQELIHLFSNNNCIGNDEKINRVKFIFEETKATQVTKKEIENYTYKSLNILEKLNIHPFYKEELRKFANELMDRTV